MTYYVLKAQVNGKTFYYMNLICFTEELSCAEKYPTYEAAEANKGYFENFFRYDTPVITVEEVKEQCYE